jgi:hypothetical protein
MAVELAGPATALRSNGSENGSQPLQNSPDRMVDRHHYVNCPSAAAGRCSSARELRATESVCGKDPRALFLDHDPHFDRLVMPLATRHREA